MNTADFVVALRDTGSFMANYGFTFSTNSGVDGTLQFDLSILSGVPELQAEACYRACEVYNDLAQGANNTKTACHGITMLTSQSQVRFYADDWALSAFRVGEFTCSPPDPTRTSCFLLQHVDSEFVPVRVTNTHFELAHPHCIASAAVPGLEGLTSVAGDGVATCPRGVWVPRQRVVDDAGHHTQSDPHNSHGPLCMCEGGWAGAHCTLRVDAECVDPASLPLALDHCAESSRGAAALLCDESLVDFACSRCGNPTRHGARCHVDRCEVELSTGRVASLGALDNGVDGGALDDVDGDGLVARCGAFATGCVLGFCRCPRGRDPLAMPGCAVCTQGYYLETNEAVLEGANLTAADACLPVHGCWAVHEPSARQGAWVDQFAHGGRATVCNGHGTCMPAKQLPFFDLAAGAGRCVCAAGWSGAMCGIDLRGCGTLAATGRPLTGACRIPPSDIVLDDLVTAQPTDGGETGEGEVSEDEVDVIATGACDGGELAFFVTNTLGEYQARHACEVLGARLATAPELENTPEHAWVNTVLQQQGVCAYIERSDGLVGITPVCTSADAIAWTTIPMYGQRASQGAPAVCIGHRCSSAPASAPTQTSQSQSQSQDQDQDQSQGSGHTFVAVWAELVELPGAPSEHNIDVACLSLGGTSASALDVDTMQSRGFHPNRGPDAFQTWGVLWHRDTALGGGAAFRSMRWRKTVVAGLLDGEEADVVQAGFDASSSAASLWEQPDAAVEAYEPTHHYAACVVEAPFVPNQPFAPGQRPGASVAHMLLWFTTP